MPTSHGTRRHADLQPGQRFGRLVVVSQFEKRWAAKPTLHRYYVTRCDCGGTREVSIYNLVKGEVRSCGCLKREDSAARLAAIATKHGGSRCPLYWAWASMMDRCRNPRSESWKNYGGRGIAVCREWHNFAAFREWASKSGYARGLTIERVNVDGNYEPGNCCFIPRSEQSRNRRSVVRLTIWGESKIMADWARDSRCVVPYRLLRLRIAMGWAAERAVSEKSRQSNE